MQTEHHSHLSNIAMIDDIVELTYICHSKTVSSINSNIGSYIYTRSHIEPKLCFRKIRSYIHIRTVVTPIPCAYKKSNLWPKFKVQLLYWKILDHEWRLYIIK